MKKRFLMIALAAALCLPSRAHAQARDAVDLSQAAVYNSPADIASWPITGTITRLDMRSPEGLSFQFTAANSWPDYIPAGWTGPLQYTVWAVVNVNGHWATSGVIQMWKGRPSTGAPILSDFARNWVYDSRWGTMAGYQPHAGEQMGFFLSAGDARGQGDVTSVRERTNVVIVSLPANDMGSFTFLNDPRPDPPPTPVPAPVPTPVPVPQPIPTSGGESQIVPLLERIITLQQSQLDVILGIDVTTKNTNEHVINIDRTFAQTMGSIGIFVSKYIAPAITGFIVAKKVN